MHHLISADGKDVHHVARVRETLCLLHKFLKGLDTALLNLELLHMPTMILIQRLDSLCRKCTDLAGTVMAIQHVIGGARVYCLWN